MKQNILLCSALAALAMALTAPANAGQPTDDALGHFRTVAAGDVTALMGDYADNARLNWVGGPLDGSYQGAAQIQPLWERFAQAQQEPLKMRVAQLESAGNPKGTTVTANVRFDAKQPIKVRYVLTYRDGKIVSETWQIDPTPAAGGV